MEHTQLVTTDNGLSILKPFDIQKEELQKLANDYANLVVTKETYDEAIKARKVLRDVRLKIAGILKDNKDILNSEKKNQESKADELTSITEKIEDRIDAGIKAIDEEKRLEKERKEKEAMVKIQKRTSLLHELGMKLTGEVYSLGEHEISAVQIKVFSDLEFDQFIELVKAEVLIIENQKIEEENKRREEQALVEKQRLENEAERKRLEDLARAQKEEQEKIAREEQVKLRLENERLQAERKEIERMSKIEHNTNLRIQELIHAGFSFDGNNYFVSDFKRLDRGTIGNLSDNDFAEILNAGKYELERIAEEIKAKQAQKEKELADKQAAFKKQQEEHEEKMRQQQEALINSIKDTRTKQLYTIGLAWSPKDESFIFGSIAISMVDLVTLEEKEWISMLEETAPKVKALKEEAEIKIKLAQEEKERLAKEREDLLKSDIEHLQSLAQLYLEANNNTIHKFLKDAKSSQIASDVQKMNEGIQEFIRLSIKNL